jgi:NADH-quinone oxidoreductase subunit A
MDSYLQTYLPVAVYGLVVVLTGSLLLAVPFFLQKLWRVAPPVISPLGPPRGTVISPLGLPGGTMTSSAPSSAFPPVSERDAPYECGVPLLGTSRERFSVRFYLVAILFVLFDIETIFLMPWAVIYRNLGVYGVFEMLIFMAILLLGFVYAWKRGGFDWD